MAFHQFLLRGLLTTSPRQRVEGHALLKGAKRQPTLLTSRRTYHPTPFVSRPWNDEELSDFDRTELKPHPHDTIIMGSDYDAVDHPNVSWNPKITSPEEAEEMCRRECDELHETNPLAFSGANKSLSNTIEERPDSSVHWKLKSGERSAKKLGMPALRGPDLVHFRIGGQGVA